VLKKPREATLTLTFNSNSNYNYNSHCNCNCNCNLSHQKIFFPFFFLFLFLNFNFDTFLFLSDVQLECKLSFEIYSHVVNCQMFRRSVKFRTRNVRNVKNSPYFPQPAITVDITVTFCEMQVT
jgi:hypothetical protein